MKFYLRDRKPELAAAWTTFFAKFPEFNISCGDIFELGEPVDAIVSPANSFGFMDGGIDYVYSEFFGWQLQNMLQHKIAKDHNGELLVGEATTVRIRDFYPESPIEYLVSAPTMRIPSDVSKTVNAYLAFRAVLLELRKQPQIQSVLCPGLGTAIGKIGPQQCAAQMYAAYENYSGVRQPQAFENLGQAYGLHHLMMGGVVKHS